MRATLPTGGHHLYHRIVAPRIQRFYDRVAGRHPHARRIVDIGCGPGMLAAAVASRRPGATVAGIDLDPVQLAIARRHRDRHPGLSFAIGDAARLPIADASVDWIVTTESYHHWELPHQALRECHRALAPGGILEIVEGCADIERQEVAGWMRALPGATLLARLVFRRHGYTRKRLEAEVVALLKAVFPDVRVDRQQGWWIVTASRADGPLQDSS